MNELLKNFYHIAVVILLCLSLLWGVFTPISANPGFAGGSGTESDPYLVANANDLDNVRNYPEAYFLQVADIDLENQSWLPIGHIRDNRFKGFYDGGGHLISNLTIPAWHDPPPGQIYAGLFGYAHRATIQNIMLTNVNIDAVFRAGSFYAGAIAAYSYGSILDNVHLVGDGNTITVSHPRTDSTRSANVGGLVGLKESGSLLLEDRGLINNASSHATVNAVRINYVGGLVGKNYSTIRHSHTSGEVIGGDRVGGLVGYNQSVITDSYSQASVTGEDWVGGLVGISWASSAVDIHRAYSTGQVIGTGEHVGGFMGEADAEMSRFTNCYWDIETSGQSASAGGNGVVGLPTASLQQQATFRYFNFNTLWQIEEGTGYPEFQDLAAYNLPGPVSLGDLAGSGTGENPYIITNADELNAMHQDLTASYRLGNDIDLSDTVIWNHGRGWISVGSRPVENFFTGSFDGSGYTIYNLTINRPRQRPVNYYLGLFGFTNNADIRNVHLEGVNIHCYQTCGGLAGRLSEGSVENITVRGIILSAHNEVGGVIGSCYDTTRLENIFADIDLRGVSRTGGIAGNMASGELHSASAVGNVQGADQVGGLVGRMIYSHSIISDSFSHISVSGDDEVGGLVGYTDGGFIENAYSTGLVSGTGDHVGGLVGRNTRFVMASTDAMPSAPSSGEGNVTNSYWNTETSGQSVSSGGSDRTTDQMTYPYAGDTYVNWDFVNTWAEDETHQVNNGYPYLLNITADPSAVDQPEQPSPVQPEPESPDAVPQLPELPACCRSLMLIIAVPALIGLCIHPGKFNNRDYPRIIKKD